MEVMTDPVVATDGHTYERAAIETWLQTHSRSPFTNVAITRMLIPNHNLKAQITTFFG
jgi:hypothetical protein